MLSSTRNAPLRAAAAATSSYLRLTSQQTCCPLPSARYNALLQNTTPNHTRALHSTPTRNATHGAQGRANGPKNGPGKRLGAKKTGDEQVIPGNILFRQRGTKWFPGENVGMGRDHTLYALQPGFVKYYRDPRLHPKRQYIGVVFERTQTLPTPANAARRRRLGMVAVPRMDGYDAVADREMEVVAEGEGVEVGPPSSSAAAGSGMSKSEAREAKRRMASGRVPGTELTMRGNYSYRESNYDIGRAPERAGVVVSGFKKGDRFLAWRKTAVRRTRAAEKRALGKGAKGSKKK